MLMVLKLRLMALMWRWMACLGRQLAQRWRAKAQQYCLMVQRWVRLLELQCRRLGLKCRTALLCCQWGLESVLRVQRSGQMAMQWHLLAQLSLLLVPMSCWMVQMCRKALWCRPLSFLWCPMVQECHPTAQLVLQCCRMGLQCCQREGTWIPETAGMAQQSRQMHPVCRPQAVLWLLTALQSCRTVPRCCRRELLSLMAQQSDSLLVQLWCPLVLPCCQRELQATQLAIQCWMAPAWVLLMEQQCWQLVLLECHWVKEHLCPRVQTCCQPVLQGCRSDLLSRLRVPQWKWQAH